MGMVDTMSMRSFVHSTKIYDFLDGDVPRSTSYGVYIFQLIRFARASGYVADFITRNKLLTQKLPKQSYQNHKLRKTISKFYHRYYDLNSILDSNLSCARRFRNQSFMAT